MTHHILGNQKRKSKIINDPKAIEEINQRYEKLEREGGEGVQKAKTQPRTQPSVQPQHKCGLIMNYGEGPHKEFFKELIAKTNEEFRGTKAEFPIGVQGIVQDNLLRRMVLVSTIANDSNLRSANLYPITPMQSEALLKAGKLIESEKYCENLALFLYGTKGINKKEAGALKNEIIRYRTHLGLSQEDLEKRLVVVNAGGRRDYDMPNKIKPTIIPGITQVYPHEILYKKGHYKFEFGLERGFPAISELGKGTRWICIPDKGCGKRRIGLVGMYRSTDLSLIAENIDFGHAGNYHITFAKREAKK